MLGGLSVSRDGRPVTGAAVQPRRLAVLAVLARTRSADGAAGISRDKLLALLWPDTEEERARRALNQTLYAIRKDLGGEDVLLGLWDLRLNPEMVDVDASEFEAAIAAGSLERAAERYGGRFLDGFNLPGAGDFERWVESERATLAQTYARVLEQLARGAAARGDHEVAVEWWRKRAAQDPLNARIAVSLMEALEAARDRNGAIQHARIYELLVDQELGLPADHDVIELAAKLRRRPDAPARVVDTPPRPAVTPVPDVAASAAALAGGSDDPSNLASSSGFAESPGATEAAPEQDGPGDAVDAIAPTATTSPSSSRRVRWGIVVAATLAASVAALWWRGTMHARGDAPTLAIGRLADYRSAGSAGNTNSIKASDAAVVAPLSDLLATNIGRVAGMHIIGNSRVEELRRQLDAHGEPSSGAIAAAARRAGATEVIDGAVYATNDNKLRLDLQRVDLASGAVRAAYTVTGSDLFALADAATARIVSAWGVEPPAESVSDVTTHSPVAYRLYSEGLRRFNSGDRPGAEQLFAAALAEDSSFAMAAHYYAAATMREGAVPDTFYARAARAERLAQRASDRDRLIIETFWASRSGSPRVFALTETLSVRYPEELSGQLDRGIALALADRFDEAAPYLRRVIDGDSLSLRNPGRECAACSAFRWLVFGYQRADSLAAAEREARRWLRLQPSSALGWRMLAHVLELEGKGDDALAAWRTALAAGPNDDGDPFVATHYLRALDFERADAVLHEQTIVATPRSQGVAWWYLAISLREQGRLAEALVAARRYRQVVPEPSEVPGSAPRTALPEAQVLFDQGRFTSAHALFDSAAKWAAPAEPIGRRSSTRAWGLALSAGPAAAAGDTSRFEALADTVLATGEQTTFGRDRAAHHYVRGLLADARGRDSIALAEYLAATSSPTQGFTRTNLLAARTLMRHGRASQAIPLLQAALRGPLDGATLFVTRTELHEALAMAFDSTAARDSATVHWRAVTIAWTRADPALGRRVAHARERLASLVRPAVTDLHQPLTRKQP